MAHVLLIKARVKGYTRKDGTFVKEHDDGRQAAMPSRKPMSHAKANQIAPTHKMQSKSDSWRFGDKVKASELNGVPEFSHHEVYGHNNHTIPVEAEFSPKFHELGHTAFIVKHPNGSRNLINTQGFSYARYHSPIDENGAKPKAAAAPETKTQNEGYGFHGEALHWSVRDKHGPDQSPYDLPQSEYQAHKDNAHKRFSEAAHKLVEGGHFADHEQARQYLDSKHGRHIHDAAVSQENRDITKVPWLSRDVATYKKYAGIKR